MYGEEVGTSETSERKLKGAMGVRGCKQRGSSSRSKLITNRNTARTTHSPQSQSLVLRSNSSLLFACCDLDVAALPSARGEHLDPSNSGGGRCLPSLSARHSVLVSAMQPPPYWTDCPLIGRPIEGTPFITAKTPIQPHTPDGDLTSSSSSSPSPSSSSSSSLPHWSIPLENTFTLSMLIRYHQQRGMQLGMIVDLTDGRFYEPQPLCRDNNITYINMYVPPPTDPATSSSPSSSSAAPILPYGLSPHYLSAFFRLLDTFTASHPSSYLLLHDIYSFDLSLFLLALYLTTNSLSPSLAFHRCCSSRPPGIADEAMVRHVWAEGGEEVEWDVKAVLKRPEWMGEEVTNWTWSGAGDRMEKRRLIEEDKAGGEEKKGSEVEERKESVKPAGTVRRKQPKKTVDGSAVAATSSTPSAAHSSPTSSSSISIASSSDPYADMLADMGLASSAPISSSSSIVSSSSASPASPSSGSHKRKAPSSSAAARPAPYIPTASPPPPPTPPPAPHANGAKSSTASSAVPVPVQKRHLYLVAVQPPHLQRLLSTLLHLVLVPSAHYSPSSFPQSSPTDIRAKLIMLSSWLDRRPITRDVLDSMVRERSQWSLTWSPVSDECLVLIMKEGTFLLFVSAFTSPNSTASPSALPPLYHVPLLSFPTKSSPTTLVSNTVAVGSLLFDVDQRSPTSPPTPRLLLTDLLSSPTHHPLPHSLSRRIAALDTDIVLPRAQQRSVSGGSSGGGKASALHVRCKKYFPLSKLASVLSMPLPHEKEGVEVWREVGDNRRGGRVWVWKKHESGITEAELLAALR